MSSTFQLAKRQKRMLFYHLMEVAPTPRWMVDQDLEEKQAVNYMALCVYGLRYDIFILNIGE